MEIKALNMADISPQISVSNQSSSQRAAFQNSAPKTQNGEQNNEQTPSLSELTKELNQQIDTLNTNVKFEFNEQIGELYISVVEKDTGNVIRQIPSEEAMKLREHLKNLVGMIFDGNY